ncbi:MAG: hypothetical protein H3C33_12020 [Rhodocyclaceae bacterium]|nr:hypothetical protein [Rhodocyclaceae bacterium]
MSITPRAGTAVREIRSLAATVVAIAIDYLRWTQLVPMVIVWGFLILLVGVMLLVSFQSDLDQAIGLVAERWPGLFARIETAVESFGAAGGAEAWAADGRFRFTDEDLLPWVLRGWAILALALQAATALLGLFASGPRTRTPWRRKLLASAVPAALCSTAFFAVWRFGGQTFQGELPDWLPLFVGLPLFAWLVSAWCLSVSHVLARVRDALVRALEG